jgi:hypothetical protein
MPTNASAPYLGGWRKYFNTVTTSGMIYVCKTFWLLPCIRLLAFLLIHNYHFKTTLLTLGIVSACAGVYIYMNPSKQEEIKQKSKLLRDQALEGHSNRKP